MKLILLISILSLTFGAPFFTGDNSQEYPDSESADPDQNESDGGTEEFNFQYTKLTTGVYTGWKIMGKSLLLAIKMTTHNNWLVVGFVGVNEEVNELKESLFFRIRHSSISVKSADWDLHGGFVASESQTWSKESDDETSVSYNAILSRPLTGLKYTKPLKMVYGTGSQRKFQEINFYFKDSFATKFIDLTSPGKFLDKRQLTSTAVSGKGNSTEIDENNNNVETTAASSSEEVIDNHAEGKEVVSVSNTVEPSVSVYSSIATTTTTTATTTSARPKIEPRKKTITTTKPIIRNTVPPTKTTKLPIQRLHYTIKDYGNKPTSQPNHKGATVVTNKPTPCPVTCNCTRNGTTDNSHWYDVIRAKENATYFAIIGTSALLTGIIVLCVACCCARSGRPQPPRSRKHKVAFYKVDDFDSADEEEIGDLIDKSSSS